MRVPKKDAALFRNFGSFIVRTGLMCSAFAAVLFILSVGALRSGEKPAACVNTDDVIGAMGLVINVRELSFCLKPGDNSSPAGQCFSVDLTNGAYRLLDKPHEFRDTTETNPKWVPVIEKDAAHVCRGEQCRTVHSKNLSARTAINPKYSQRVVTAVSDDGDLLAMGLPDEKEGAEVRIEVYETVKGSMVHSFTESYLTGGLDFAGHTLLLKFCAAGPGCETRMMNVARKRALGRIGTAELSLNTYDVFRFHAAGSLWAFISPQDGRAVWMDISSGRTMKDIHFLERGTDPDIQCDARRIDPGTIAVVLASPHAGQVVIFDLNKMAVVRHYKPPVCPPSR